MTDDPKPTSARSTTEEEILFFRPRTKIAVTVKIQNVLWFPLQNSQKMLRRFKQRLEMYNFPDTPRNRSRSPASPIFRRVCPVSVVHQPATHCALIIHEKNCHCFCLNAFPPLNHRPKTGFVRQRVDHGCAERGDLSGVLAKMLFQSLDDSSCLTLGDPG